MSEFIAKYFSHSENYPDPAVTMLRPGLWHAYLSNSFLDGWINYVTLRSARLITRYEPHEINLQRAASFNAATEFHTSLGKQLRDDVLILGRAADIARLDADTDGCAPCWWVFWFDRDVSDCCIGRFETTEDNATVIADFVAWADDRSKFMRYEHSGHPSIELSLAAFRGWISS